MLELEEEISRNHECLISNANAKRLGTIHWILLCSNKKYQDPITEVRKNKKSFEDRLYFKFITWWVRKNQEKIRIIKEKTEKIIISVKNMKDNIIKMRSGYLPDSYIDFIESLSFFSDKHSTAINQLYDFVLWLKNQDEVYPAVLFSYQEWGSTRRAQRALLGIGANSIEPSEEELAKMIEVVYGLRNHRGLTWKNVYLDIITDLAENIDPEFFPGKGPSFEDVVERAIITCLVEFEIYMTKIRDSLQTIISEIRSISSIETLKSNKFLIQFISKAKAVERLEHQLWDFKETISAWNTKKIPKKDKEKLESKFAAKVAGFGNSKGGIIIVGIDNKSREILGVSDAENNINRTRIMLDKYCNIDWAELEIKPLPTKNKEGKYVTCLILMIPEIEKVVSIEYPKGKYSYPVRMGCHTYMKDYDYIKEKKGFNIYTNFNFSEEIVNFVYFDIEIEKTNDYEKE